VSACELPAGSILNENPIFREIYNGLGELFPAWLCGFDFFLAGFVNMFMLVNGVLLGAAVFVWVERRLIARLQNRIGPNRWGPFGLLQPIADLVKLLTKEDLVPKGADRIVFTLVPIMMMAPVILMLAVVPVAKGTVLADLNIGVLYVVAITGVSALAIFMAGWGSANRYALFGAMRGVAMLISYEVPVVVALVGVVLVAGSMKMTDVVDAQTIPFFVVQPLAMIVFVVGICAELNRTPFDIVEAESELIAGYHIEYSGIKFALIQAAEFGGVLTGSAVMVTLFMAGWKGPFLSDLLGPVWFLLKVGFVAVLFIWVRATFPRLRIDQVMAFAWKFLFPLSIINLFASALEVFVLRDSAGVLSQGDLGIMAGVNIPLTIVSIGLMSRLIGGNVQPALPTIATTPTVHVPL
jgi:NADH-quinone oxidoreductase subunit H